MRERLRGIFPPSGLQYRLFDSSVMIGALSLLWYISTDPSSSTDAALSGTLSVILAPDLWGTGIFIAAFSSAFLAYGNRISNILGYCLLAGTCGGWAASIAIGALVVYADGSTVWQQCGKSLGSALIFAWVTRSLITAVMASSDAQGNDKGSV